MSVATQNAPRDAQHHERETVRPLHLRPRPPRRREREGFVHPVHVVLREPQCRWAHGTLQCVALRCVALRCVALLCVALLTVRACAAAVSLPKDCTAQRTRGPKLVTSSWYARTADGTRPLHTREYSTLLRQRQSLQRTRSTASTRGFAAFGLCCALRSVSLRSELVVGTAPQCVCTARHGTARHGTARHGTAWHGLARHGTAPWHGTARHGTVRHCTAMSRGCRAVTAVRCIAS